ncbi:hypothetical protein [Micromonospora cathayae]|uniref:Prenyltransferase and squalene oxidase repeat-containing protein n=1 Tax=Micromonospora cathayae TaxID=3028804 RepID=A0ABY7ZWB4_9ACTN|nr:hypothetical protein [Micromonospora sp. HUAS 3]WDZ87178.1 hypothetical protein PVK37_12620 [Micromonospora sp. HUAS 3]
MTARGDAWKQRAVTAISRFRAIDNGTAGAYGYASMAEACGRVYGWTHTWTKTYLNTVYNLQNPDGGWGLGREYDAFADGSVNDPDTTYTVTLSDHVGMPLLTGFQAGAVPRDRVQGIVNQLMAMPRIPVERGACVAYSTRPADCQPGYEVHNVSAGAGYFLHRAASLGFGATGMHRLITDITIHQVDAYRTADVWWPYIGSGDLQDPDHQSYSAQSMYPIAYWVGRECVYKILTTAWPDDPLSPLAHMRLVSTPGGVGSWSRTAGSPVTLWGELGDRWLTEADTFIATQSSASRLAQAAVFCARNAGVA